MPDQTAALVDLIRSQLCLETGEPWVFSDEDDRGLTIQPRHSAARLHFRTGYGAKATRLEVSGAARVSLPRGGHLWGEKYPAAATFSMKREPAAIAREIVRKILPDLRALVVAYEKAAADQRADDQNVSSWTEQLVHAAPSILRKATGHTTTTSASTTLYTHNAGSYGSFTVTPSGDCKVALSHLRLATALRIAELLEADAAADRAAEGSAA